MASTLTTSCRPTRPRTGAGPTLVLAAAAWGLCMGQAQAGQLGRLDLAAPGAMISTCSGINWAGSTTGDMSLWRPGQFECNAEQTSSSNTTVTQSSSYQVPGLVSASASGYARMGQMGSYATFTADNSYGFSRAEATTGWMDQWTLMPSDPADLGATATLVFGLHVDGSAQALPVANSGAEIRLRPYLDDASLAVNPEFVVTGQGQLNHPFLQVVDTIAYFSIEVTLGDVFELGVFSRSMAGVGGVGGTPGLFDSATSDFLNTITWAGIQSLTVNGASVGYRLSSASGIDWTQPFGATVDNPVPEPGSALLLAAGIAALARRRRCAVRPTAG